MSKKDNSRNFARMPLKDLAVQVTALQADKADQDVIIDNISLGGVSILSPKAFISGDELLLTLNKSKAQFVRARVKWCDDMGRTYRCGLEFLVHNGNEKETVTDFVGTLLNMLSKEKVIQKALDLFCLNLARESKVDNIRAKIVSLFKRPKVS